MEGPSRHREKIVSLLYCTEFLPQRAPVTSEAEQSVVRDEKWERGTDRVGWTAAEAAQTAQLLTRL